MIFCLLLISKFYSNKTITPNWKNKSLSLCKLRKISLSKGARNEEPMKKSSFVVVVRHRYAEATEESRHCCTAEHSRPQLLCCARILKQALVINRPQTIGLTQLCLSIHFTTLPAVTDSHDLTQLGIFTDRSFSLSPLSVSNGSARRCHHHS